jgi:uncharacterized protein (DUF342 family)
VVFTYTHHMAEPLHFPVLSLAIVDDGLMAYLAPSALLSPVLAEGLNEALAALGLDQLDLNQEVSAQLLQAARSNQRFEIQLAKARYADFKLALSADGMRVTADAKPSLGGKELDVEDVEAALLELGVLPELVDRSAIALLRESGGPVDVARGRQVKHGTDTNFEAAFGLEDTMGPAIDERGIADYFETKYYVAVDVGDVLMRRQPATDGDAGTTVLGKEIKATKGKVLTFKKHPGSEVSSDDDNLLLASAKGHPVIETQGVRVDQTLSRPRANLDSGNINFDGSVIITGDVFSQVHIIATGDIFVKGTVENAHLEAGNNIVIGGGVISESAPNLDEPPKITTTLSAGGDVHAKFLNQTSLTAKKSVLIQSYVMNSELEIEENLVIGEKGGKGALIGGSTFVGLSATLNSLGSSAYVHTELVCGRAHELRKELAPMSRLLERRTAERKQLEQILSKIQGDPAPTIGEITLNRRVRITKVIDAIEEQILLVERKQLDLMARIEKADVAFVQVNRFLYPQVRIVINGEPYVEHTERTRTKINLQNGHILFA